MSKQHCRMLQCPMLLRHGCRFWQQFRSNVRLCCQKRQQCRTSFALKFRPFDKVERCFDIVASVDRALVVKERCFDWMWWQRGPGYLHLTSHLQCYSSLALLLLWPPKSRPLYFTALIHFFVLFRQHRRKTSHGISTNLGQYVGSGADLQMPPPPNNLGGLSPNKYSGAKKHEILTTFCATFALDATYLRNETSHRQTKIRVSIYNVSPKSWPRRS